MKKSVFNCATGETAYLELTPEDIEKQEKARLEWEEEQAKPKPPTTDEKIDSVKVETQTLDERTMGMQAIDDFTLQAQATIDERTVGMQEIDDFTLLQVTDLQQQVDQLKADVAALKGGA